MGLFRRPVHADSTGSARLDAELAALRQALDAHESARREASDHVAALDARLAALDARLAGLDARVTAVATELANQLTELGHDIDGLQERPASPVGGDGDPVPGPWHVDLLDEIRDGQLRLANEQARYQIAFRQDLAHLAALVRRPAV